MTIKRPLFFLLAVIAIAYLYSVVAGAVTHEYHKYNDNTRHHAQSPINVLRGVQ